MEKQKIKNVIEKLKSLDLSTYPVEDVRKLLMELQQHLNRDGLLLEERLISNLKNFPKFLGYPINLKI
jgi:hypothetical protein